MHPRAHANERVGGTDGNVGCVSYPTGGFSRLKSYYLYGEFHNCDAEWAELKFRFSVQAKRVAEAERLTKERNAQLIEEKAIKPVCGTIWHPREVPPPGWETPGTVVHEGWEKLPPVDAEAPALPTAADAAAAAAAAVDGMEDSVVNGGVQYDAAGAAVQNWHDGREAGAAALGAEAGSNTSLTEKPATALTATTPATQLDAGVGAGTGADDRSWSSYLGLRWMWGGRR